MKRGGSSGTRGILAEMLIEPLFEGGTGRLDGEKSPLLLPEKIKECWEHLLGREACVEVPRRVDAQLEDPSHFCQP